jgi:predicted O-methyltransferase YrrM
MISQSFIWVENILAAQVPRTVEIFNKIIKDFDLIIEIGTYTGGFAIWLNNNKKEDCKFITYEINDSIIKIPLENPAYKCIRISDCFSNESISELSEMISQKGRVLFLCDGGNKIDEFKIYSKLLKKNDVIMMHDYVDSPNELDKWNDIKSKYNILDGFKLPEASYSQVENLLSENKLKKFMYDDFLSVFWGSFIKE